MALLYRANSMTDCETFLEGLPISTYVQIVRAGREYYNIYDRENVNLAPHDFIYWEGYTNEYIYL